MEDITGKNTFLMPFGPSEQAKQQRERAEQFRRLSPREQLAVFQTVLSAFQEEGSKQPFEDAIKTLQIPHETARFFMRFDSIPEKLQEEFLNGQSSASTITQLLKTQDQDDEALDARALDLAAKLRSFAATLEPNE